MKNIIDIYKKTGNLHHAYFFSGEKNIVKNEIYSFLNTYLKFPINANPDYWQGEFNVFKIDDARELIKKHLILPVKYQYKIFIIFANSITREAQNSLLKIFEETQKNTVFFLVLSSVNELLPTLKSRLLLSQIISTGEALKFKKEAGLFLEANIGQRLNIINKLIKEVKDEKITKSDIIIFLKNIAQLIKKDIKKTNNFDIQNKNFLALESLEKGINYASDESPSIKVILEHLALVLPHIIYF